MTTSLTELRNRFNRVYSRPVFDHVRPIIKMARYLPDPVLVYQMGKVGSTTVFKALRNAGVPAFHVHYISREQRHRVTEIYDRNDERLPTFFQEGRYIRYWMNISGRRKRIISMVRDPIARQISSEFQTADVRGFPSGDAEKALNALTSRFTARDVSDITFGWFEDEFAGMIGVNLLDYSFDRARGFVRISVPQADILIMTLEKLSTLEATVSEFVGRDLEFTHSNVQTSKVYSEVKRRFCLPRDVLEEIYDHERVRHFYCEEARTRFTNRWACSAV